MKKFVKFIFATSVLFTSLLAVDSKTALANQEEYEIYPLPHDVEYHSEYFNIPTSMTCYFENGIDDATKNRAYDVLGGHDIIARPSDTLSEKNNLIIGLYNNKKEAYNRSSNVTYIETKYDAYYLKVENENIIVLGKDTDSAFYGLASLELILNQVNDKIRTLEIRDFSDSKYRGFIEGFYGNPYSPEQREELMRFGSKHKANIYIYAPKDDIYHSSKWRNLYDDLSLARLKEQIEEGARTKTRLCYALHPFINDPITPTNYDASMQQLLNKMQQIYDAGVRQFCISGDDALLPYGMTPSEYAKMQNKILNTIANWVKQKGDCYNLAFVPSAYCFKSEYWLGFDLEDYYSGLMNADGILLDESIEIMWTGNDVCSTLGDGHLPDFIRLTNGRKPFIWMNYPVNDFNPKIILMGPGEVYDIEMEDEVLFAGIVANVSLEAEPSKVALFNTCDYTWNVFEYDVYTSYDNSFKYIEENAYEALREICQHLRNTGNLFSGKFFTEGTELLELKEKFELARKAGSYEKETKDLIDYFVKLKNACKTFKETAANKALLKTMKPWVDGIEYAALSGEGYLTAILHQNDYTQSKLNYIVKDAELNQLAATHQTIKSPNAVTYNQPYVDVMFGHNVLMPFINDLNSIAKNEVSSDGIKVSVNYGKEPHISKIYGGLLNNMVDGDLDTYVTFEKPTNTDSFYMMDFDFVLDYGTTQSISKIDIYQGQANSWIPFAECMRGKIYASNDGTNWTEIAFMTLDETMDVDHPRGIPHDVFVFDEPVEARYLKFANYYTVCWITIREISINDSLLHPAQGVMYYDGMDLNGNSKADDLIDNNSATSASFTATEENASILIDLLSTKDASGLHVLFDQNKSLNNYKIEVSKDGYGFETIENDLLNYEATINFDTIKKIRYIKVSGTTEKGKQIIVRDIATLY